MNCGAFVGFYGGNCYTDSSEFLRPMCPKSCNICLPCGGSYCEVCVWYVKSGDLLFLRFDVHNIFFAHCRFGFQVWEMGKIGLLLRKGSEWSAHLYGWQLQTFLWILCVRTSGPLLTRLFALWHEWQMKIKPGLCLDPWSTLANNLVNYLKFYAVIYERNEIIRCAGT